MSNIVPTKTILTRRQMLQGACGALALTALGTTPAMAARKVRSTSTTVISGLRAVAEPKGKTFGVAVGSDWLSGEADYATAVRKEASMMVSEYEMKWSYMRPTEATFNFTGYDRMASFASANNMKMRGHTLVWHSSMPQWALDKLATKDPVVAQALMAQHMSTVMGHCAAVKDWDVVNEAIDNDSPRTDKLRVTPWLEAMGPDYIGTAYRLANSINPSAKLVYNEFGLEGTNVWYDSIRRKATLDLLTKLKSQGVPIHALGLQSHLGAHLPLSTTEFVSFLKSVRALGLEIMVTELDIRTDKLSISAGEKLTAAASYVAKYLDLIRSTGPLNTVVTWGISDRHSWITEQYGTAAVSPLPLNSSMQRLAFWNSLYTNWANV